MKLKTENTKPVTDPKMMPKPAPTIENASGRTIVQASITITPINTVMLEEVFKFASKIEDAESRFKVQASIAAQLVNVGMDPKRMFEEASESTSETESASHIFQVQEQDQQVPEELASQFRGIVERLGKVVTKGKEALKSALR